MVRLLIGSAQQRGNRLLVSAPGRPGTAFFFEEMTVESGATKTDRKALFLRQVDEAFNKKAWHGPNLRGAVRRVTAEQAGWRPGPGRHNIAEIVVHCAYWKYAVRRRIRGDKRGSFPLEGSNWFDLPQSITERQWREYLALLDGQHEALREAIEQAGAGQFAATAPSGANTPAARVYGIAMHDVYHAGQIQTIKALYKARTAK